MLTWPHAQGDWADALQEVEAVLFTIAREIARREMLLINCATADMANRVTRVLYEAGVPPEHVITALVPSNDSWARDHGPLTVLQQGQPRLLDFRFNGWGNKYPSQADNAITARLTDQGHFGDTPVEFVDLVLEGGSIDSDGAGSLLTTRSCLLHPQRNPQLSAERLAETLCQQLGAQRLLWLQHGALEGDDSDGHIDMLARFTDPDSIVYQSCREPGYRYHAGLQSMQQELVQFRTLSGKPYRLRALPWPSARYRTDDGSRLPASYANFLVINGAVLLPVYDDPADDEAAAVLQACFPQRDIIPIPCLPLIQQFGSLHCLTMQFPKAVGFGDNY